MASNEKHAKVAKYACKGENWQNKAALGNRYFQRPNSKASKGEHGWDTSKAMKCKCMGIHRGAVGEDGRIGARLKYVRWEQYCSVHTG